MIDLRWQVGAACTAENTADFYLPPDDPEHRDTTARLKQLCKKCPVLVACRAYSLEYETQGFWAGMTVSERRRVRSQEGIARKTPGSPLSLIKGNQIEHVRTPADRSSTLRRSSKR